ncbi:MAG: hypothetical protein LBI28_06605 [Treponema sp.]|jgi:hypothetical protein|nr:hypothetical protein [Treponema sp.]
MKKIFMVIILFIVTTVLFCEDLEYITIRRTMLYANPATNPRSNNEPVFEIDEGTTVKYSQRPYLYMQITNNGINNILGTFIYDNTRYYINCADLIPADTVDAFNPSFISDLNSNDRKTWVPSYYTSVLQSLDRDTVLLLDLYWEHDYDPWWQQDYAYGEQEWHDFFDIFFPINEFDITNSALVLNRYIKFLITNINKTAVGYTVTVKFTSEDWYYNKNDSLNWDKVNKKEFFDMLLCVDGDYMDVYLDDMEHKLTTFVLVDQIFLNEMRSLIRNNRADLSRITFWPQRAGGYSPPLGMSSDSVPRRNKTSSPLNTDKTAAEASQIDDFVQSGKDSQALPLWALLTIIGGAIVVAGGVVVFIVKRKK